MSCLLVFFFFFRLFGRYLEKCFSVSFALLRFSLAFLSCVWPKVSSLDVQVIQKLICEYFINPYCDK